MSKHKNLVFFIFGIIEAIIAVVCFSRGLVDLFGEFTNKFKLTVGVGVIVILIVGFVLMSIWYLHEPKKKLMDEKADYTYNDLNQVLSQYTKGKYFGPIAKTVMDQLGRLNSSCSRTKEAVSKKFDVGSMSYQKYYSIVDVAEKTANQNVVAMTNRMKFFDEDEYARLENYRNDNIPDDIQERQIALYKENQSRIEQAIAVNENLILKLDTLTMELTKTNNVSEASMDTMLSEIEELTKEVKFYT
ncbi:MAG: hypothetical protein K5644_08925 [Lachnospiraceae bacterium]|nr:hypothetical protein [Lachnospiraceae bacterium]